MADGQLALDVAPARVYGCCGLPCGSLHERATIERPFPHAPDCPNPNVGAFVHRETGMIMRALHCIAKDGSCPTGGRYVGRAGVFDPYDGACCLTLRTASKA